LIYRNSSGLPGAYLEVPKFETTDILRVESRLDWWMYVFKKLPVLDDIPEELKSEEFIGDSTLLRPKRAPTQRNK
jgi:hypothetical protein